MKYYYIIEVDTDTSDHADLVVSERIDFDEPLLDDEGHYFNYTVQRADEDERFIQEAYANLP